MDKLFSNIYLETTGSQEALTQAMDMAIDNGAQSLFVLGCEADSLCPASFDVYLKSLAVPVFGGIFPRIVYRKEYFSRGTLVCSLSQAVDVATFTSLSRPQTDFNEVIDRCSPWMEGINAFLILLDGLSKGIDPFIEQLYSALGSDKSVVGAGAGSLELVQKPCLISNEGLLKDAAQVVGLPASLSLGVRHGWKQVAGPFLVTDSQENFIRTLNYRPAFQVYRENVEALCGESFSEKAFFDIAKTFPFGMEILDDEVLIRDPIQVDGDVLVCVGKVPRHTMLYLMQGHSETLIGASAEAAQSTQRALDCGARGGCETLLFDCISRILFLGSRFDEELAGVYEALPDKSELIGALSLGEIASTTTGRIRFFNKTTVVGAIRLSCANGFDSDAERGLSR